MPNQHMTHSEMLSLSQSAFEAGVIDQSLDIPCERSMWPRTCVQMVAAMGITHYQPWQATMISCAYAAGRRAYQAQEIREATEITVSLN